MCCMLHVNWEKLVKNIYSIYIYIYIYIFNYFY